MKLVEESEGKGRLSVHGEAVADVPYAIRRYQAMTTGGMPVPGLHRIEGRVGLGALPAALALAADTQVNLELEDGRRLALTLVDADGQVLAEGHGPGRCGCC
jgi:hypothetical protein